MEVEKKPKRIKKPEPEHADILGQPLAAGSYVAVSHHNMLQICQVSKINPKTVNTIPLGSEYGHHKSPDQVVVLSGPDALAYILRNAGKQ